MCALRHSVVIQEFLEALKVEVKYRPPSENESAYACDVCEVQYSIFAEEFDSFLNLNVELELECTALRTIVLTV